jgi:hypothetical protein
VPGRGRPPTPSRARRRTGRGRPVLTRPIPLSPAALAQRLADLLAGLRAEPGATALRVAVDGPDLLAPGPLDPTQLAAAVAELLPIRGRAAVVVPATGFYRAASLRLEHGRTDPDARYTDWLDAGALAREVLAPTGPGGEGTYLPVLRDLERDRAARADPRPMPDDGVLLVPGPLLQGIGLPFDVVVHLRVAPAARSRRAVPGREWELPAYDRYDDEVDPVALADAVVLADHPERPALVLGGKLGP